MKYDIVLLSGAAKSGKDTAADFLQSDARVRRYANADSLKAVALDAIQLLYGARLSRKRLDELKNSQQPLMAPVRDAIGGAKVAGLVVGTYILAAHIFNWPMQRGLENVAIFLIGGLFGAFYSVPYVNVRSLLQHLGTSMRTHVGADVFVDTVANKIAVDATTDDRISCVITDARYANEARALHTQFPESKIAFVQIVRDGLVGGLTAEQKRHSSETGVDTSLLAHDGITCLRIENNGTLAEFATAVQAVLVE